MVVFAFDFCRRLADIHSILIATYLHDFRVCCVGLFLDIGFLGLQQLFQLGGEGRILTQKFVECFLETGFHTPALPGRPQTW